MLADVVQVAGNRAAVGEAARYCPRTVSAAALVSSIGWSALSTFTFSSRSESASSEFGGSIATRQRSCIMWFCTMSQIAPDWS